MKLLDKPQPNIVSLQMSNMVVEARTHCHHIVKKALQLWYKHQSRCSNEGYSSGLCSPCSNTHIQGNSTHIVPTSQLQPVYARLPALCLGGPDLIELELPLVD